MATSAAVVLDSLRRADQRALRQLRKLLARAVALKTPAGEVARSVRAFFSPFASPRRDPSGILRRAGRSVGRWPAAPGAASSHDRYLIDEMATVAYRDAVLRVATEAEEPMGVKWLTSIRHVKADECCRAGTMVETDRGPMPIERIGLGDRVLTHERRHQPVIRLHRRTIPEGDLVRVTARSEKSRTRSLVVTPNHPVLTGRGWVPAGDLRTGDRLSFSRESQPGRVDPLPRGAWGRGRPGFAESVPSSRSQSIDAVRYGEGVDRVFGTLRTLRGMPFLPTSLLAFASGISRFRSFLLASLGCLRPFALVTPGFGVLDCGGAPYNGFRSWGCRDRGGERMPSSSTSFPRTVRTRCRRLGTFVFGGRGEPDSTRRSKIDGQPRSSRRLFGTSLDTWGRQGTDRSEMTGTVAHTPSHKTGDWQSGMGAPARFPWESSVLRIIRTSLSYVYYTMSFGGRPPRVVFVDCLRTDGEDVFNLGVAGDHSYYAGGIAVHNCDSYAEHDSGLGRGVFLPSEVPNRIHARCLCVLTPVSLRRSA